MESPECLSIKHVLHIYSITPVNKSTMTKYVTDAAYSSLTVINSYIQKLFPRLSITYNNLLNTDCGIKTFIISCL